MSERLAQRAEHGVDASEADEAIMRAQLSNQEPLSGQELNCALLVNTSETLDFQRLSAALHG